MNDLYYKISELNSESKHLMIEIYKKTAYDNLLKKGCSLKKQHVRANEAPFINKTINKEIMKQTRLNNKFFNSFQNFLV